MRGGTLNVRERMDLCCGRVGAVQRERWGDACGLGIPTEPSIGRPRNHLSLECKISCPDDLWIVSFLRTILVQRKERACTSSFLRCFRVLDYSAVRLKRDRSNGQNSRTSTCACTPNGKKWLQRTPDKGIEKSAQCFRTYCKDRPSVLPTGGRTKQRAVEVVRA